MEKSIQYINRNFDDYRKALIEYSKKYYPNAFTEFDDASVGSWLIDLNAEIGDNLSYHIDRVLQETNINSAKETNSIYSIARNNGFKIPGPKGAMAEVRFSCKVPVNNDVPDESYLPIIRRGTKVSAGSQIFEVMDDIDFSKQFDKNGASDKEIIPVYNSNGQLTMYRINKYAVVVAGESLVYKRTIGAGDIKPFMEVLVPVEGVMNVESVIFKEGTGIMENPSYQEFYSEREDVCGTASTMQRFFEVESLAQQKRWGDADDGVDEPVKYGYQNKNGTDWTYSVTKGEWKPVKHKFITEYTDKGYLKIIFGSGIYDYIPEGMKEFSKYQISRVINNPSLGLLPNPNTTMFVLYRAGGGASSNVAAGAINAITKLNVEFNGSLDSSQRAAVISSISCESTTASVSGRDMPTTDELRYMIKYNAGAQNRCVTVKDYVSRIYKMPPRYGTPYRVGAIEANNKMMIYLLGIDNNGKLDSKLPKLLAENIQNYLRQYRMINDYVEIKSGKVINLSFEVDMFVDKNYNKPDVVTNVINTIKSYMDISKHNMGDDVFVGDIEKEITKIDGVLSIIGLRVYNLIGGDYSTTPIQQATTADSDGSTYQNKMLVDLEMSDGVLYSDGDSMFEIKYPEKDIILRIKER